jgi:hypothetical protein
MGQLAWRAVDRLRAAVTAEPRHSAIP